MYDVICRYHGWRDDEGDLPLPDDAVEKWIIDAAGRPWWCRGGDPSGYITLLWQEDTFDQALSLRRRLADSLKGVTASFRETIST
jgi:hypothetical protein